MRAGADRAGKLAHGNRFPRGLNPLESAAKLVIHQGEAPAESGRLGMNAMAAANHRRELMFPGLAGDNLPQSPDVFDEDVRRFQHLHGEGRVHDVAAGQAEVEPAAGRCADVFGDVGSEGDNVVIEGAFEFLASVHVESGPGLHLREVFFGHQALSAERLAGKQFDLQPDFELALVAPDFPHRGARVTLNHSGKVRTKELSVEISVRALRSCVKAGRWTRDENQPTKSWRARSLKRGRNKRILIYVCQNNFALEERVEDGKLRW